MNIYNTTGWRVDDLRAIVRAALKAAGLHGHWRGKLYVKPSRTLRYQFSITGRAMLGKSAVQYGRQMWLGIPQPEVIAARSGHGAELETTDLYHQLFVEHLCQVAHHEALHLVGARHKDMTEDQLWCRQAVPWSRSLVLRPNTEVVPREVRLAAASQNRLEHARVMHKIAVTRRKRAETIEKKWRRRLRALEKKNG